MILGVSSRYNDDVSRINNLSFQFDQTVFSFLRTWSNLNDLVRIIQESVIALCLYVLYMCIHAQ